MSQERKRALHANRDMLVLIDRRLEAARQTVPELAAETLDTGSFLSSFVSVLDKDDKRAGIRLFDILGPTSREPVASPSGSVVIDSDAAFLLRRVLVVAQLTRFVSNPGRAVFQGFVSPKGPLVKLRLVLNDKQTLTLTDGQEPRGGFVSPNYYAPARGFDGLEFNATLPVETALARNSVVRVEVEAAPSAGSGTLFYQRLHVLFVGTKVFG